MRSAFRRENAASKAVFLQTLKDFFLPFGGQLSGYNRWIKQWGGLRQFKVRGSEKVSAVFGLHVIAYNLIRLGNLLKAKPSPREWPAMAAA